MSKQPVFKELTETAGTPVTREGASMVFNRYAYAAANAPGKRVLEIACGAGLGTGLLSAAGAAVVGGDIELDLLRRARSHYPSRFPFLRLDAQALPFRTASFGLCLLFEAAYYVPDFERALDEIARVLDAEGTCIIVSANPERADFIPSPFSHTYHRADELAALFEARGFETRVEGAYPVGEVGFTASVLSGVRRVLTRAGLVPKTLKGRALLKRLIYGKPTILPPELPPDFAPLEPRVELPPKAPAAGFKVLYVTASKA